MVAIMFFTICACNGAGNDVIMPSDTLNTDTKVLDTNNPDTDEPDTNDTDTDLPDTSAIDTDTSDTDTSDTDTLDTDIADTEAPDTNPQETEAPDTENIRADDNLDFENAKGIIYLTFDDGPCNNTKTVLDILDKYNVKATFFFVGDLVRRRGADVAAVLEAGHEIGCHSMTHIYKDIYKNGESIKSDIQKWEKEVINILGGLPVHKLYRFPGGSTCSAIKNNFSELYEAVSLLGYRSFDWNCSNNDRYFVDKREDETEVDFLKRSFLHNLTICGRQKVLLLHETSGATVETLEFMLEYLISEGYVFSTLDKYDGELLFRKK